MLLVVDASVLIDYAKTDTEVLGLAARHLGRLHVPTLILDEVEQLGVENCQSLGLDLVEVTAEQLVEAARTRPGLSFQDMVCLLLARDNQWTCVTNDKRLRRACGDDGIAVLWGLQLMLQLVQRGQFDTREALHIAQEMNRINPFGVPDTVLVRFKDQLAKSAVKRKKKRT